jgi:acetylornithine deacetylase/succinyl-diaminopimelate desuccinylase family protein
MVTQSERERITSAQQGLESDAVSFLQELIRIPSYNPPGDYEAIEERLVAEFEGLGWETETVWTPDEVLEDLGLDPEYPRPNVLGYVTRGDGPTIALNAHLDTVPVDEDAWTYDPFGGDIDEGCVWGRGAKDSKGRIASYTLAGRILEEADLLPEDATVVVAVTADEETGGKAGAGYVTDSGALRPDFAIVEGSVDVIWRAASAVIRPDVVVSGEASHAGTRPEAGANAVVGAARVVDALDKHAVNLSDRQSEIPGVANPTCVPAMVDGGVKTNIVPPSCRVSVDMRVPPDFDAEAAEERFREVVDGVTLPAGTETSIEITQRSTPYVFDEDDVHIQALKANAEAIRGEEVPVVGTRGSTDARFFAPHGAKCVNYGPGDDQSNAHGSDEHVEIEQVSDVGATVAASIVDIARGNAE